jgi:hypothetical protein
VERVSGPADQPAAFNEMPDRPIGSTRLLQQNRHLADLGTSANVRFVPILFSNSGSGSPEDVALGLDLLARRVSVERRPQHKYDG